VGETDNNFLQPLVIFTSLQNVFQFRIVGNMTQSSYLIILNIGYVTKLPQLLIVNISLKKN